MSKRTIAIGDIHGCSVALRTLLAAINPQAEDIIITMGDYVDRGPDSHGVLEQLFELVDRCELVPLLGNHDLMLLQSLDDPAMFAFWQSCGGDATLASYRGSLENIPLDHLVFLRGLRPYYETDTHIFVHANYDPGIAISQVPEDLRLWQHVTVMLPRPHYSGKKVIVGHTPQANGCVLDLGHLVCIDTYCFGGGWLTALNVDTGEIWQADQQGESRHA